MGHLQVTVQIRAESFCAVPLPTFSKLVERYQCKARSIKAVLKKGNAQSPRPVGGHAYQAMEERSGLTNDDVQPISQNLKGGEVVLLVLQAGMGQGAYSACLKAPSSRCDPVHSALGRYLSTQASINNQSARLRCKIRLQLRRVSNELKLHPR